jgi:hypothetical protein
MKAKSMVKNVLETKVASQKASGRTYQEGILLL